MKKILYIIGVLLLFASCAKDELMPSEQDMIKKSFNLTIEEPDYAPQSRVESPMVRYMLEMYEGDLSATPVKMTSSTGKVRYSMAYCASVTVNSKSFDGAIVLKRAVAELSFIEKNGLTKSNNARQIHY